MFHRIMFIIVLALFALVPASLVYAEFDDEYFNLGDYTAYTNIVGYQYSIHPALEPTWFTSELSACNAYKLILLPTKPTNQNYGRTYIYVNSSNQTYCMIERTRKTTDSTNGQLLDPTYAVIVKRAIPACDVDNVPRLITWSAEGQHSPYNSACAYSCEYQYAPEAGVTSPPRADYSSTNDLTSFVINDAKRTGKSCSLNVDCVGDDCPEPEPEPEPCTAEQKAANGGTCPVPDDDGNTCPDSEKLANGGKCQVPDTNGNKCPTAEKTANGGTCQTADSDGNKCTDALKAASGGKCPTAGTGDCTAEQKAANGGTCPAGSGGTCTANPINKKFCDLADWLTGGDDFELPDQETEIPKREISRDELPQSQQINFPASCPAGETFSAFGQTVTLSYDVACDLMRMIRPFVILAGNLLALFIFINSIRN